MKMITGDETQQKDYAYPKQVCLTGRSTTELAEEQSEWLTVFFVAIFHGTLPTSCNPCIEEEGGSHRCYYQWILCPSMCHPVCMSSCVTVMPRSLGAP